ncbi:MAG: hypothetical protein AAFR65_05330 [Pseudomonadota bacterium]
MQHAHRLLLLLFLGACASPVVTSDIYRYGRVDDESWIPVDVFDEEQHLNYSYVECSPVATAVLFYWPSEDGDWWVIDTYAPSSPEFSRTIHFDQWDVTLTSTDLEDRGEGGVTVDGTEATEFGALVLDEYAHLMDLFHVWSEFPYPLPTCAREAFDS